MPMEILDYRSQDVADVASSLVRKHSPFGLRISGWRSGAVRAGMKPYLKYRASYQRGNKRPLSALAVVPFALVSPTFWMLCVRAEINGMALRVERDSKHSTIIVFEPLQQA